MSTDEVIAIHKILISEFGGKDGLRDLGLLESAIAIPQTDYYSSIIEETSALMESQAINHPFIDGNKRVSFFATDTFLRINGYFVDCDNEEALLFSH